MGWLYLTSEYRRLAFVSARRVAFLATILGAMVYLAGIWPVMDYYHTAGVGSATYDVRLNGPITLSQFAGVTRLFSLPGDQVVGVSEGTGAMISVAGRAPIAHEGGVYLCDAGMEATASSLFLGSATTLQGGPLSPGTCALDVMSARKLRAHIGDVLEYSQSLPSNDGTDVVLGGKAVLRQIYGTSSAAGGLLAPLSRGLRDGAGSDGFAYSDIYVKSSHPAQTLKRFGDISLPANCSVFPIAEARRAASRTAVSSSGGQFRSMALYAGMLVYLAYVLREQFVRVNRRRRAFAIMFSMGYGVRRIVLLMLAEQTVICAVTGVVGLLIGIWWIEASMNMYIPQDATATFVTWLIGLNLLALALLGLQLAHTFRRFPVSRLLATGKEW